MAWYRTVRTLRRRSGGYLTVVLLLSLVGGLALAALAGARQTQSAYPSYLAASDASDLQATLYVNGGNGTGSQYVYQPALTARLARLPDVRRVAAALNVFALPLGPSGQPVPEDAGFVGSNEVNVVTPENGEFFSQDDVVPLSGRLLAASRPDEIMATSQAARLLHLHVGERLRMGVFTYAQAFANDLTNPPIRFTATVVGTVTLGSAVVHDAVDQYPTFVILSPALTQRLVRAGAAGFPVYDLTLSHGAADVTAVEHEIIANLSPRTLYSFHETSVVVGQVERAIKPESIALGAFGFIALIAALVIAAQSIGRSVRANANDSASLRAVGAGPLTVLADSVLGLLSAVVLGALGAVAAAVALSPIAPIGAVRAVDPAPGFRADWTVLGGGLALFVVVLSATALMTALLLMRRLRRGEQASRAAASSSTVAGAVRLGMPPSAVAGLGLALNRGHSGNTVPVGSALIGAVLAVTVVVTTLTFGSGLSTLVSHPTLYGWNWNFAIEGIGGGNVPAVGTNMLTHDHDVAAWTGFNFGDGELDGQTVPFLITDLHAALSPPILSGHGLRGTHQIVLGASTLAALDKRVGETVQLTYGSRQNAPAYIPPLTMTIVGTATLPAVGNPGTLHPSMGTGALVPDELIPPAFRKVQESPDPNSNGWAIVVVRTHPGISAAAGLASMRRVAAATTKALSTDPNAGNAFQALGVQQPAEIVNYKAMGSTPALLASGLAVGAVIALGITLVSSVRRRRRDLAYLKTLGFVQRQLAAVVAWQASVAAVAGVVIGVPVGIVLGRVLWGAFARQIVAVPRPTVPTLQLVLVVGGALVLANLVAFIPGRLAARTSTAEMLRAE